MSTFIGLKYDAQENRLNHSSKKKKKNPGAYHVQLMWSSWTNNKVTYNSK